MRRPFRLNVEPLEGRALLAGGDLAVTLTTDQAAYQVGQPVHMTLTETNTTDHDVRAVRGCGIFDIWANQGATEVWRKSQDGPQPLCAVFLGVLHAHETRSFLVDWNGQSDEGPPSTPTGPIVLQGVIDDVMST